MSPALVSHARAIESAPRRLSYGALVIALALHAALALLFVFSLHAEEGDEAGGASVIEVEIEMAAPKIETADATPGPESDAAAAAPYSAQQQKKAEATARREDEPAPADTAEIIAARNAEEQPERETPETALAQSVDSISSVASQDSAPPLVPASLVAATARAQPGAGPSVARENAAWRRRLAAHLARHKSWPAGARRSAEVAVRFRLERSGRIAAAEIVRSSGLSAFDDAALALLKRADPAPAPPAHVADDALTFTAPIVFRTRER
jgi:periplasmic protein TonB